MDLLLFFRITGRNQNKKSCFCILFSENPQLFLGNFCIRRRCRVDAGEILGKKLDKNAVSIAHLCAIMLDNRGFRV